jgi:hypothetical protein
VIVSLKGFLRGPAHHRGQGDFIQAVHKVAKDTLSSITEKPKDQTE